MDFQALITNPIVKAAVAGVLVAAAVDFQAFRSWKSFSDIETYAWKLALFRWVQGAVVGALTAVGFGSIG